MLSAVVTGVAGQDGSYLSELLLEKGYRVIGIARRRSANREYSNINHLIENQNFIFIEGSVCDPTLLNRIIINYKPDEWYNLAAQSNVGHSFKEPVSCFEINAKAVLTQLDCIRSLSPYTRFYQASTSELWGGLKCPKEGYSEGMRFHPRSPYGVSKLAAYWSVVNYREAYGMYACNGILHNHSSPRRGLDFATRKITNGVAKVKCGLEKEVRMGNLSAFRDEGHSKDFVRAMYLMLQQDNPEDFVISTGSGATIEEMFKYVCSIAKLEFKDVYRVDERYMRPSEVPYLLGNSEKAKDVLGWKPEYSWKELLKDMYENDLENWRRKCQK